MAINDTERKSFNEGDREDINNLFTNTLLGNIQVLTLNIKDRDKARKILKDILENLDDEDALLKKMDSIQEERDLLLVKKNVRKNNK